MQVSSDDQLLASAASFLIEGQEEDVASVLLTCSLGVGESGDTCGHIRLVDEEFGYDYECALDVKLTCPQVAYEILRDDNSSITRAVRHALEAVIPDDTYIRHFTVHAELIDIDSDWRTELLEIARGKGVYNQAVMAKPARIWKNLRFRSQSEVQIAQALDRVGVLFLPNCMARLGSISGRRNREADFLICYEGKWGILEVDGEPFHPPTRTVKDHERDRLFRSHGILVVEHFDASKCYKTPEDVVEIFLKILKGA
ncbi:MAG: hypothetical protein C5S48_08895 [Candidatus Methanogaster sp.]|nr:MAG: hypothetical protein C5S48_08895 [ANME-2 cluster archaeon]